MGPEQVLSFGVKMILGEMTIKRYSVHPRSRELEYHHHIQFSVISRTPPYFLWGDLTPFNGIQSAYCKPFDEAHSLLESGCKKWFMCTQLTVQNGLIVCTKIVCPSVQKQFECIRRIKLSAKIVQLSVQRLFGHKRGYLEWCYLTFFSYPEYCKLFFFS